MIDKNTTFYRIFENIGLNTILIKTVCLFYMEIVTDYPPRLCRFPLNKGDAERQGDYPLSEGLSTA
jgi:hypothetical protein